MFIFQWIVYSNVFICFWLRKRPSIISAYATVGGMRDHPKCVQLRTAGVESRLMVRTHLSLFMFFAVFFSCSLLFYLLKKLILPLFKKDVFVRNGYLLQQFLSSWNKLSVLNVILELLFLFRIFRKWGNCKAVY